MKKTLIFLAAISLLMSIAACETQLPGGENGENLEYVEFGLVPKGIDISSTPMQTKGESSDLYMVSVYKDIAQHGNEYAAWLTDDLQSEKFKLLKGHKYTCCVYYFPDGKNILADYESGTVYPVCGMHLTAPRLSDGILYGAQVGYGNPISGAAMKKGDIYSGQNANGYYLNDVVRYYGRVSIDASEDLTADIDLYMQMVGLNVTATNLHKGSVKIYSMLNVDTDVPELSENNAIYLTPTSPSVDKIIAPDLQPWYEWYDYDEYLDFEGTLSILIDYIDENDESINILRLSDYAIKRMTKLNITLDIEEVLNAVNAGIKPNVITGEDWTEVSYN